MKSMFIHLYSNKNFKKEVLTMTNELKELIFEITNLSINTDEQLDMDFNYLGIDSLMYMMIIVQIEEKYSIQFNEDEMGEGNYDTINKLIDFVESELK